MTLCLEQARKGAAEGQYPVGAAVVANDGEILSIEHNRVHAAADPTAHTEVLAIRQAAAKRASRHLPDCFLYTTLEPCPMCAAAAIWARMIGIVFGASQQDAVIWAQTHTSENFTWRQILVPCSDIVTKGTPVLTLHEGFMRDECRSLFELTVDKD